MLIANGVLFSRHVVIEACVKHNYVYTGVEFFFCTETYIFVLLAVSGTIGVMLC